MGCAAETWAETQRTFGAALNPRDTDYAARFVDELLPATIDVGASDVHLQPIGEELWLRWRIDGVLQDLGRFPKGGSSDVITRLKVLADLLTYRSDAPQEGRLRQAFEHESKNGDAAGAARRNAVEMRLSTFPTLHGERAVIRVFAADCRYERLTELGLPARELDRLTQLLGETSGALLVTGPAGGGKTTTCYAMLRHLAAATAGGRSIVSIEDPVEVEVAGVAQANIHPPAGFDLASGLKALLRQDPEVIMISEIRDATTAALGLGASLTGHLVIGSFHAGSAAAAVGRLIDMGVEPYVLRSGVLGILSQRLVRRLCDCANEVKNDDEKLGLPVNFAKAAAGCNACLGTGYRGRTILAELLLPRLPRVAQAIAPGVDVGRLEELAVESGMCTLALRAADAVERGLTSPAEVRRVLGFGENPPPDPGADL